MSHASLTPELQPVPTPAEPGEAEGLDRRHLLQYVGAALAALAAPAVPALADPPPCDPTSTVPEHLRNLDPCAENALVPHAHRLAVIAADGKQGRVLAAIDDLVKKNKAFFKKNQTAKILSALANAGLPPTSIRSMFSVFEAAWTPLEEALCVPAGGECGSTACAKKCKTSAYASGSCKPLFTEEPCSCICDPGSPELQLFGSVVMALLATPNPAEIPALLAGIANVVANRIR